MVSLEVSPFQTHSDVPTLRPVISESITVYSMFNAAFAPPAAVTAFMQSSGDGADTSTAALTAVPALVSQETVAAPVFSQGFQIRSSAA